MGKWTDISNYTSDPLDVAALVAAGYEGVLLQAFPPDNTRYAQQRRQMRAAHDGGLRQHAYLFDYLDGAWVAACLRGLDQAASEDAIVPEFLWADEEYTTLAWQALSIDERVALLTSQLALLDAWCAAHSLPPAGIYTAAWWWATWLFGVVLFATRKLWAAQYDGVADVGVFKPFGGWTVATIKQFAGTSAIGDVTGVDLDVLDTDPGAPSAPAQEETVLIPDAYVQKFHLANNQDVQGLIDNFEGVIRTVQQIAYAQGESAVTSDATTKLDQIKQIVGTPA